jgi:2-succinyl-5-enolpyruvyl-6-hydroxy-3-cyclohexene-1-carboxylate synthase
MVVSTGRINQCAAQTLIDNLHVAGIRHAVISPGSRSSPLALACDATPGLKTWVIVDERSAAFFALGIAKATRSPVVVIATSGSAPAHWYPAVIEASRDHHPLILISADRPPDLQHCGANQTIDQTHLFGTHVRWFAALPETGAPSASATYLRSVAHQATGRSRWPLPGPVHINFPFREPLLPDPSRDMGIRDHPVTEALDTCLPVVQPTGNDIKSLADQLSGKRGLIVCGCGPFEPGFNSTVSQLARRLACPLLADPLSGLRFGDHDRSHILTRYDTFLRGTWSRQHAPEWILRFGATPVSKPLQRYLASNTSAHQTLAATRTDWQDPDRVANHVVHSDAAAMCEALLALPVTPAESDWLETFIAEEQRMLSLEDSLELPLEAQVLRSLAVHCPEDTCLFASNSMTVRDADSFLGGGEKRITVLGNRGASGIDGNVSTTLGISASGTRTIGLIGDLALVHDMNGLLAARELSATLVIFNTGGGGIFEYLPQRERPEFERYWLTPASLDIAQIARLFDLGYHCAGNAAQFETALRHSLESNRTYLIEVTVDREKSVALHKAFWEKAAEQL